MSEGIAARVEMFRDFSEATQPAELSCSLIVWELLWQLGHTFGWRPKGATYAAPPGRTISKPALHNYDPGEALDRKWVDAGDALAWAAALDIARRSPHLDAMLDARYAAADGVDRCARDELRLVLDRFIEFARSGAFEFAVAEAPADRGASDIGSEQQPPGSGRNGES